VVGEYTQQYQIGKPLLLLARGLQWFRQEDSILNVGVKRFLDRFVNMIRYLSYVFYAPESLCVGLLGAITTTHNHDTSETARSTYIGIKCIIRCRYGRGVNESAFSKKGGVEII
jgi:hypothetical protein